MLKPPKVPPCNQHTSVCLLLLVGAALSIVIIISARLEQRAAVIEVAIMASRTSNRASFVDGFCWMCVCVARRCTPSQAILQFQSRDKSNGFSSEHLNNLWSFVLSVVICICI